MFEIGYTNFAITLFLLSGGVTLVIDVKNYKQNRLKKEMTAARFLGWMNLTLGVVIFLVNWGYYIWFI